MDSTFIDFKKEENAVCNLHGIFDTHAHYYDAKFDGDADRLLADFFASGGDGVLNVATRPDNFDETLDFAVRYPCVYTAVGIHPEDCHVLDLNASLDALENRLCEKKKNKILAVGEIGLDYHAEAFDGVVLDKAKEKAFFDAQLSLAEQYDLPVVIHDRESHGDVFDLILAHKNAHGVLHSFSGSAELAREYTRRGWYLGFGGVVTFKNADRTRAVCASVPTEFLLCETDAPYMAPHPFRGNVNASTYLPYVLTVMASLHGLTAQEMTDVTRKNARNLFKTP